MTIDSTGWAHWARRYDGPAAKVYADRNAMQGVVCHSAEGWLAGTLAELEKPEREASWHFTIDDDGTLYQHYPITASCWASGNYKANVTTIAVESIGTKAAPLTDAQERTMLNLASDLELALGIKLVRGATLWEHNEVAQWEKPNAGPTSCPSHRYDGVFESMAAADAPPATDPRDSIPMHATLDYCDALNDAVKALTARVERAFDFLPDVEKARAALKP